MQVIKDRLAFEPRDTWQARCIIGAKGRTSAVLMSVLCHNFEENARALYELIFPGCVVLAPYLESAGRVDHTGAVVAKVMGRNGFAKEQVIYPSEIALRDDFRRLADEMKLTDADRVELFAAVKRWVVADRRIDPNMDPKDPDAKRLTVH